MNDRELLELAAKAAGEEFGLKDSDRWIGVDWDPLTDDGDALRLAVKLRLVIKHATKYVVVLDQERAVAEHEDTRENGGDQNAATRRCIVRAAAELAKEKQ